MKASQPIYANGITRRNFMKTSVMAAGSITVLTRGTALATGEPSGEKKQKSYDLEYVVEWKITTTDGTFPPAPAPGGVPAPPSDATTIVTDSTVDDEGWERTGEKLIGMTSHAGTDEGGQRYRTYSYTYKVLYNGATS